MKCTQICTHRTTNLHSYNTFIVNLSSSACHNEYIYGVNAESINTIFFKKRNPKLFSATLQEWTSVFPFTHHSKNLV